MSQEVELYYNEKVVEFLTKAAKVKVFKAGRGAGKTRGIPEDILMRAEQLPRGRIFMASTTFEAISHNIMPDVHEVFKLHGLVQGEDYVVDKAPPAWFEKPYKVLDDPRNSIHLFNGFAIQKVSFAKNVKKYRGRSFDGGIIDEALNFDGWAVDNILLPCLRGLDMWDENPLWKMLSIYSSHPRSVEGSWFLRYEDLAKQLPGKYAWVEATAYDNIAVVGEEYIEDQKTSLTFIDFNIEILNKGNVKDLPTLFYHQFKEKKHCYRSDDLRDVDPHLSLALSFDFGGRYSCVTVSQTVGNEERIVYEFDTNNLSDEEQAAGKVKKVPQIVQDFVYKFKNHSNKRVEIWGERMGLKQDEMEELTIYEKIIQQLESDGWDTELMVTYEAGAMHKSRWTFMNATMEELIDDYPILRINLITCPNLVTSLEMTRITDDFKKDKKDERKPEFNQSHAPHLTDTLDYKLFNKYFYLLDDEYLGGYSGIDDGIESF
jgi:hypothetical protein